MVWLCRLKRACAAAEEASSSASGEAASLSGPVSHMVLLLLVSWSSWRTTSSIAPDDATSMAENGTLLLGAASVGLMLLLLAAVVRPGLAGDAAALSSAASSKLSTRATALQVLVMGVEQLLVLDGAALLLAVQPRRVEILLPKGWVLEAAALLLLLLVRVEVLRCDRSPIPEELALLLALLRLACILLPVRARVACVLAGGGGGVKPVLLPAGSLLPLLITEKTGPDAAELPDFHLLETVVDCGLLVVVAGWSAPSLLALMLKTGVTALCPVWAGRTAASGVTNDEGVNGMLPEACRGVNTSAVETSCAGGGGVLAILPLPIRDGILDALVAMVSDTQLKDEFIH